MHGNKYTGHTTKRRRKYERTNKKSLPRWYRGVARSTKREQDPVRKRRYLEYVYQGQGPQRQDSSKICGGANTYGARLIRKFNCKKRLTHLLNSCSPGASWGCGILPRVTMSQKKAKRCKRQAASVKQQAASRVGSKAFGGKKVRHIVARHYVTKTQGASGKHQAPSNKHQAASRELRAL
jgi:hypothetical protein